MVGGTSSVGLNTLQMMRMVVCCNGNFILTPTIEQPPAGDEDEDDELDGECGNESSLPSATKPTGLSNRTTVPPNVDPIFRSFRLRYDN